MTDYMKFYNDPGIINEPAPLREVHAIRLATYEEIKDMTAPQLVEYYRKSGETVAKEYGLRRIASISGR